MKKIFLVVLLLIAFNLFCNEPPVVSNVVVEQRDDGTYFVDIYYDLEDADGDNMIVNISASDDEGESWSYLINNVSGDIGLDIISGYNKHIIWDFADDHPEVLNIPTMIKITADDFNAGGIEWCLVEEGTYTWGENDEIQTIDYDYEIMKYEVTNSQYLAYLQEALEAGDIEITATSASGFYAGDAGYVAGVYDFYNLAGSGRIIRYGGNFIIQEGYENHPVVQVTWFGANAYTLRYGLRLPTEQEWEKAARGMTGYDYPWGNDLSGDRANYWNSGDPWDGGTTPVGFYNGQLYEGFQTTDSPSPYNCYDMSGNVCDWTEIWYGSSNRGIRGGSYYIYGSDLRSWSSWCPFTLEPTDYIGFRCARTVE